MRYLLSNISFHFIRHTRTSFRMPPLATARSQNGSFVINEIHYRFAASLPQGEGFFCKTYLQTLKYVIKYNRQTNSIFFVWVFLPLWAYYTFFLHTLRIEFCIGKNAKLPVFRCVFFTHTKLNLFGDNWSLRFSVRQLRLPHFLKIGGQNDGWKEIRA